MFERASRWSVPLQVALDLALINVAFVMAYFVRYELQWIRPVAEVNSQPFSVFVPIASLLTVILLAVYRTEGLYRRRRATSWLDDVYTISVGTLVAIAIVIFITFIYRPLFYSRLIFAEAGVLIVLVLSGARWIQRWVRDRLLARGIGQVKVLIVGAGELGRVIMRSLVALPHLGYQVVGFVDDDPTKQDPIGRFPALGRTKDLASVIKEHNVEEAIISLPWRSHQKIVDLVAQCESAGIQARIVPDLFQMSLTRVDVDEIAGIPLLGVKELPIRGWNLALKRIIDGAVSALLLAVTAPLILLIALAIKLESRGPVLFPQPRVGRGGRVFTFYKFRTMRPGAEEELPELMPLNEVEGPTFKIKDDPRRTRVGTVLRRTSLDELPQLYNVLRGEMSLVGPRPAIQREVEGYRDWHKRRFEIQPGVTGLWQVMGRSDLTFDEMVMLDLFYAENWSLWLDLKILLRTVPAIIRGTGAY
ncbi:MAG: sugar transferase [Anaerolineae bacterium]